MVANDQDDIKLIIETIKNTIKISSVELSLLSSLGNHLASISLAGMITEEKIESISEFLFASEGGEERNYKEPLLDFFIELSYNLELSGIDYDKVKMIVDTIYNTIKESTVIINTNIEGLKQIKERYIGGLKESDYTKLTNDKILVLCCLIRVYITQYQYAINLKSKSGEQYDEHQK